MPDDPATAEIEREQAIVLEAIAALEGHVAAADDHPTERRRVRVVIEAIRAAR